jgi:hypothetical protein
MDIFLPIGLQYLMEKSAKGYRTPSSNDYHTSQNALMKKDKKFSSYIRKYRWDPVQSHI